MALMFKKIQEQARNALGKKTQASEKLPRKDIQRENIEMENVEEVNFRFSSIAEHIKKNLMDLKSINKKF